MDLLPLAAKSLLAAMLLVAGSAKLADLASFAAAVRLFAPVRIPRIAVRWVAAGIAVTELALGSVSLSWPSTGWINPAVFTLACGFTAVSDAGYLFRRGQSCRCFGALSNRKFDAVALVRSAVITVIAAVAMSRVRSALIGIGGVEHLLLLLASVVVAFAAFTAARTLAVGRKIGLETR
jgi:methylamine utilization protein MauE